MEYQIYSQGLQWRWRLVAANNEIIASGESYHNKSDCLHAIRLIKGSSVAPVKEL